MSKIQVISEVEGFASSFREADLLINTTSCKRHSVQFICPKFRHLVYCKSRIRSV